MNITINSRVEQSYKIIDKLILPHGLFLASLSSDYSYVWLRDSFYMSIPFLNKNCGTYEKAYWRILDLLKDYEWKLDIHIKQKPVYQHEYIHARYSANDVKEIEEPWGHSQNDAIGAILFGIGEGLKRGKKMLRDTHDLEIVQKIVYYIATLEYWNDEDSGMWEEIRERRSSSIAACVAGLKSIMNYVDVPPDLIKKGMIALYELFPYETKTRNADLAQLSLIYPYNVFGEDMSEIILANIEENLLRDNGVIRYRGDSYYSTLESEHGRGRSREFYVGTEAEWCFGFGFLALAHAKLGNKHMVKYYIEKQESVMLPDGSIPELYYSRTGKYNVNTPLGWANSMFILSVEEYERM